MIDCPETSGREGEDIRVSRDDSSTDLFGLDESDRLVLQCGKNHDEGSVHNINNFFVKTLLNYTFFKRSWHH